MMVRRCPTFLRVLCGLAMFATCADLLLAAAMIPPPHVYSAVLHNSADSAMAIEVHYVMETDSETLQESKTLDLPAGQDVTLEQMTRDEGEAGSPHPPVKASLVKRIHKARDIPGMAQKRSSPP